MTHIRLLSAAMSWRSGRQGLLAMALLIGGTALAQKITVYSSAQVPVAQTRQLTAYVQLANPAVHWTVNGVPGGNAALGTISASGLYSAPATVPLANAVNVTATSVSAPSEVGSAVMTITQVPPHLWSARPASFALGTITVDLNGRYFNGNSVVRFAGVDVASTVLSPTALRATLTTTAAMVGQSLPLQVRQNGLGGRVSETVMVQVQGNVAPPPVVGVTLNPISAALVVGGSQAFAAAVSGSSNTAVIWSVNGVAGGNALFGTVTAGGVYSAPGAVPNPASVSLRATSVVNPGANATAVIIVTAGGGPPPPPPPPGSTADLAAGRLLEQAAFGPTPALLARVKTLGVDAWLAEQFAMPETPIAMAADNGVVRQQYLNRLSVAPDQLRQRVAYALSQILVISMNKNPYPAEVVPHLQMLSRHAFGNYRALLGDVAMSSQMGKYLDLANSNKPMVGANGRDVMGANENFARELLQLFSIGLVRLNPDGSTQRDAQGQPLPSYDQNTVAQLALALTGWTYAGAGNNNWENFTGPLVPREVNHDTRGKVVLHCALPAGQGSVQEMNAALDCVFQHANVAPFVATRLIRGLVTSNPSPAYVRRVAQVFENSGSGVRGDLRATVRAILTDAEARNDGASTGSGRLKDAIFHIVSVVRAMGGSITTGNQFGWQLGQLGQMPLAPNSVFSFYSPLFRVPTSSLFGPEFQIYTPTEAVLRGNLMWQLLNEGSGSVVLDWSRYTALAGNVPALIDAVDQTLLYGRMPAAMRSALTQAVTAQSEARSRAITALYLTLLSGQQAVQY